MIIQTIRIGQFNGQCAIITSEHTQHTPGGVGVRGGYFFEWDHAKELPLPQIDFSITIVNQIQYDPSIATCHS
jgi:hypothetical protein